LSGSGASTAYEDETGFWGIIGGNYINNSGFIKSFEGIIHSAFFKSSSVNAVTIASTWLVPRISPSYTCDYFTGMFNDFGVQLTGATFNNQMYNYAGNSQMLTNSIASTVDATNGLSFSATEVQAIQGVKVTVQRAIGIQFWFKGSFSNNQVLVSLCKSASVMNMYIDRNANNIRLKTTQGATTVTFSGAISSINISGWTFIALSVGWLSRNNNFIMCGYIYQAGNYDLGDCSTAFTISTSDMGNGVTLYTEFGPGLIGTLKEAYVTNHLGTPYIFSLFKNSIGTQRYHWFDTDYHIEPHYIKTGCGNGYILPGDSGETWDDLNTNGGDGCSGSWIRENLYKCTEFSSTAGTGSWAYTCGDGMYESAYGEQWDDGDTSSLDGWSSICQIENGWDWSGTAIGDTSVCNSICGDNFRVFGEAWDDGDNTDNEGWKADCSGELNGWHWSGGSATTKDTWTEQCGDGYVTPSEQWEDGNTFNLDGCSSTCQIEPGWNWVGTVGLNPTTCTPIWGDNYRVAGEAWDDGNNGDNQGCKVDCSGELNGWHCSGGSATTKDIWVEQCNDGYITTNEQCEDGNTSGGDGWDSNCHTETGWTWVNNVAMTSSVCTPIWGDGLVVGPETCDDGDDTDNKGCNDQWNGIIRGWYWSLNPSAPPAHICNTQLMDGIHVSPEEGWDDGNSLNLNDGCTNSGIVEYKWDWVDDLLQRSIWVPMWGNGKQDHADEECDDENYDDDDGCTNWLIDQGYQCFNGSATTRDNWYKQPIAEISYLSKINELTIKFTEPMENIDVMDKSNLNLTITGPMAPYQFTYKAGFEDEYTMMVNITMTSQMAGDDEDLYTLYFNTDVFVSKYEPKLITKKLYGFLYKVPILPDVVGTIGAGANNIMSITLVALVGSNVLLGQSSELLWGFMNTIQIMFFFPLLMLYYPDHLVTILTYLKSARMMIELPPIEGFKSEIKDKIEMADKIDMTSVNERYESLEYYSTSILLNGEDIFGLALQGLVICMIVFAFRACFFTLQCNISVYEEELEKMEKGIKINSSPVAVNPKSKKEKFNRWFKNKIKEMSQEYKFNFFLRMILQLFLETIILSLLNIRFMSNNNFYQVMSTLVSWVAVLAIIIFFVWALKFSWKNFQKYRQKDKIDIDEVESMFGQYRTKYFPQAMFNTYFMTRRVLYACIIVFLPSYPILQAFSFMVICLPMLAFHLIMNPYHETINNAIMNINEFSLISWGIFFFMFAEPDTNADRLLLLGWAVIGIIIWVILMNILVLWFLKIKMIRKNIHEFWDTLKLNKKHNLKPNLSSFDDLRGKIFT
jgi:cysteine-rich repeat protein